MSYSEIDYRRLTFCSRKENIPDTLVFSSYRIQFNSYLPHHVINYEKGRANECSNNFNHQVAKLCNYIIHKVHIYYNIIIHYSINRTQPPLINDATCSKPYNTQQYLLRNYNSRNKKFIED